MHVIVFMQIFYCLANIFEIWLHQSFRQLSIVEFDFVVQCPIWGVLKDHVGDIFLFLVVVIEQLDDVGMVKFVVHIDFFLGIFIFNL